MEISDFVDVHASTVFILQIYRRVSAVSLNIKANLECAIHSYAYIYCGLNYKAHGVTFRTFLFLVSPPIGPPYPDPAARVSRYQPLGRHLPPRW